MLAGLLFATHDADDRHGALAATLPFGGVTLIEYQARLLIQAGVTQVIVVVARLTPELLGAIARIGRRGIAVDTVRSAAEASARLHPLARILMLADGLVTTDALVAPLAREGEDALLVVDEDGAPTVFELVGGHAAWAGVARLSPQRLAEVATLPADYDVQSALLRVAAQARAQHIVLADDELRRGHGIERRASALEARGHAVMATLMTGRRAWFDRWIVAPIARRVLPIVMRRVVPGTVFAAATGVSGLLGLGMLALGYATPGLLLVILSTAIATIGATVAWLRDENGLARGLGWSVPVACALAVLIYARVTDRAGEGGEAVLLALVLVGAAALTERATSELRRKRWWGTAPAFLLVLVPFAVAGAPLAGLALAAIYAATGLAHAVEGLRRDA